MNNDKLYEENFKMRERKMKQSANRLLYGFLIIFVAGYLFFFTSTLWLPVPYQGVEAKPLGTSYTENNRTVTIDKWEYSKEQKMMEVLIEIEDYSIDGLHDYSWTLATSERQLQAEVVAEDEELVVLRAQKVPRGWKEAKVVMDISEVEKAAGGEFTPITIYTNNKIVSEVDEIKDGDLESYKIAAYTNRIEVTKENIATAEEELKDIENQIREAEDNIASLKEKMEFQTDTEKADSEGLIDGFNNNINSLTRDKELKEAEIAEMKQKIELTEMLLLKTTDPDAYAKAEAEAEAKKKAEAEAAQAAAQAEEAEGSSEAAAEETEGGEEE